MRVVHVYKDVYPPVVGGIEKHIDGIRVGMTDVSSDVVVGARKARSSVASVGTGIEVRVAEFGRCLSVPLAPTLPRWVRRLKADLFHIHMPNPPGELAAVAALRNRPYVVSYHADIVRQAPLMPFYRPLVDACLGGARSVIVGSNALARTSRILARHRDRIDVVPYAVDTARFDPARVSARDRERVRAQYGTPLVLALGRLVYYKGYEHLIAAAGATGGNVVIAGIGPQERRLRSLAERQPNVRLVGEVTEDELTTLLSAADCFVLPSVNRAESFGVATLEAQAMGVPAVVTDVGTGTTEAIEPDVTGLVVPPGDSRALAEAIRALIEDPERRSIMGRAAIDRVASRHSREAQIKRLRSIYQRAASVEPLI